MKSYSESWYTIFSRMISIAYFWDNFMIKHYAVLYFVWPTLNLSLAACKKNYCNSESKKEVAVQLQPFQDLISFVSSFDMRSNQSHKYSHMILYTCDTINYMNTKSSFRIRKLLELVILVTILMILDARKTEKTSESFARNQNSWSML